MTLQRLYPYGGALTRPVTIPLRNRAAWVLGVSVIHYYLLSLISHLMWALSCLSGWVNKATSNIVPFTERHPLSQPVRAASSPKGGAEGASRRGLYHPSRCLQKSGAAGGFYPPLQMTCEKCSSLHILIDFYEHLWYNIFTL